ncbi:MAG: general secretion pathway protein B [Oleispira sp.]|jgi:general secretion pathway protein B
MSYILQALKKSEQERELAAQELEVTANEKLIPIVQIEENVVTQAVAPPTMNAWLMALLVLAALVIAYVFQQTDVKQTDAQQAEQVDIEKEAAPLADLSSAVVKKIVVTEPLAEDDVKKVIAQEAVVVTKPLYLGNSPIAVELAPKDVQSLIPNINITSHIYSSLPTRRSIVVNGERLVETDFISSRVQVKEITHQGMIINVDGLPLVIDRSRGWSR